MVILATPFLFGFVANKLVLKINKSPLSVVGQMRLWLKLRFPVLSFKKEK